MSYRYRCYSLLLSSEIALPELLPATDDGHQTDVDVRICLGAVPSGGLLEGQQLGPYLWVTTQQLWLHVPGVARFLVSQGREIRIDPESGVDEDSLRVFLLGSALGALLFQRGFLVLHGNAIRIGDSCLICVGHSGAGKSTLAAAFLQRGYGVLADDVVPIDRHCHALSGFPRIKLWQDTANQLGIDTQGLRRIRPDMEKFNYPVPQQFVDHSLPVKWVYILGSHHLSGTLFEPIQGMARFNPLRNNTYRVRYLDGMALKAEHLKLCGQLAGRIRLARVTRPEQGFGVNALVDRLLADAAEYS